MTASLYMPTRTLPATGKRRMLASFLIRHQARLTVQDSASGNSRGLSPSRPSDLQAG
ncbi:hypothetical protein DPMN_141618 [Dreissena polymorpha]|uniref:Uncharacterized protein n=1 Tax=Dreissena polymorpha TaxID=45954 RepID=A0A9D4G9Q1_DREPO|nr:hypothetical protein DPMN_141618 [Dreissena polymorpha]